MYEGIDLLHTPTLGPGIGRHVASKKRGLEAHFTRRRRCSARQRMPSGLEVGQLAIGGGSNREAVREGGHTSAAAGLRMGPDSRGASSTYAAPAESARNPRLTCS